MCPCYFCASQGLDAQAKNLVTLGNLLLLPLVLLFLNSLPWQQSFEAAKFYISNNCQANGGSTCVCVNSCVTCAITFYHHCSATGGIRVQCLSVNPHPSTHRSRGQRQRICRVRVHTTSRNVGVPCL